VSTQRQSADVDDAAAECRRSGSVVDAVSTLHCICFNRYLSLRGAFFNLLQPSAQRLSSSYYYFSFKRKYFRERERERERGCRSRGRALMPTKKAEVDEAGVVTGRA
jgi:hypothetical protein